MKLRLTTFLLKYFMMMMKCVLPVFISLDNMTNKQIPGLFREGNRIDRTLPRFFSVVTVVVIFLACIKRIRKFENSK